MKNGTLYAKRVKRVYQELKRSAKESIEPGHAEPLEQMVLAHLAWEASPTGARRALKLLREQMIDLNEVRVSTIHEIAAVIRESVPNSMDCARGISRCLNTVFKRESCLSLESLKSKGIREARQYLETLDGINPYVCASVLLWSLGGHAVPVSRRLLSALQKQDLIDPTSGPGEVQSFLERHVPASETRLFCRVMEKFATAKAGHAASTKSPAKPKKTPAKKKAKKSTAKASAGRKKT
ncbi:MAG: hypothetical protein ACE5GE_10860 [Phycisphaerae bacterium]